MLLAGSLRLTGRIQVFYLLDIKTDSLNSGPGTAFLEYLEHYNSPVDLAGDIFVDFSERIADYLDFIRKKDRDEDSKTIQIGKRLRDLGAPMESYKILKSDALYYKSKGDINMYLKRMYLAGAFANLGFPVKSIEQEAKNFCEELRKSKEFQPFLPLFLLNYAGILHIYRENYRVANEVYKEAISTIRQLVPDSFYNMTGKEYLWALKLISNNYIDSLLYTDKMADGDEELARMLDIAEERMEETESEYARFLTLLNKAEIMARRGETEKADKILEGIIRDSSGIVRGMVEPGCRRIKAIILALNGHDEESIDYIIRALEESGYYGNTLCETLTMRDGIHIYNILAKHKGKNDQYIFYREKGLFDYLLEVLKVKDWYLGSEHTINVKNTAIKIAEILLLKKEAIRLVGTSALLHDIGKCAIPWYSLNKITPLDDLDWEILKVHPIEGARMLRKLGLDEEAEIAENHHERTDGSGYPEGKMDISLETEIVAISDVFNSATTPNRKYKNPQSPADVLREIRKGEKFSSQVICGLEKYIQESFPER